MTLILTSDLGKRYITEAVNVDALIGVDLAIEAGESVAITGPSGSGKSTLLSLLGCLDVPTSGSYLLGGEDVSNLPRAQLAAFRNERIGLIFQSFNLLPRATALENVELPLIYAGLSRRRRRERASEVLDMVGLSDRLHHLPSQLSGGQQQRVAIARALANSPSVLLADEPTGSLDSKSSAAIQQLLSDINGTGVTVIIVTHDSAVAAAMSRIITIYDGRVASDVAKQGPCPAELAVEAA